jgi:hypothetical protein
LEVHDGDSITLEFHVGDPILHWNFMWRPNIALEFYSDDSIILEFHVEIQYYTGILF